MEKSVMLKLIISFIVFSGTIFIKPAASQQPDPYKPDFNKPAVIPGYVLSWHDEFNKNGKPDPENWIYERGFVRNKELQWYQPDNAECINGLLVIEGRRERVVNPHYQENSSDWRSKRKYAEYTSACLETKGLQQFGFGSIVVRARIDTSLGAWPAIWTLGTTGRWPLGGEVDILEYYPVNGVPTILANTAWGRGASGGAIWNTQRYHLSDFISKDPDWVKKFHVWRMDRSEDSINLYLDDKLMNTTLLKNTLNPDGTNPFLNPQFLLLNLAIGSTGGNPDHTKFPIRFEVDYARYYKKTSD